jgi:hypothetical protein
MRDGYQRKIKVVFIAREASHRYSNGHRFGLCAPTKCVILIIMHRVPVIHTIKQTGQLFREMYTEDMTVVQQTTRVTDSSMCIEHIINPA